ncbi:iron uptake porin (plasmid) [Kovacikia minuta CCNUW1]|uniref:iron uptake porin n=1 Tax=Kovacikia minuta TaxID=2931930 RepID=UPI001CCD3B4F|nr:iron uptake porin [Kovacikia minuta]UBF30332.1 iron uptake porin [Kovacikia minuta CCNUW1]
MNQYLHLIGKIGLFLLPFSFVPLQTLAAFAEPSNDPIVPLPKETENKALDQVTSVSQLSDVRPTDWAFQALQSLVERYGCIVGYPDKTYRGNRALSRYEFAAGLNACLDRINELIASATADLVKKEDLVTAQKLQEEFAAELAALRGRVDALETRTATLEKQQFSTTTKLSGEVIFSLSSAYGAYRGGNLAFINNTNAATGAIPRAGRDAQIVFNDRVRLNLLTSFSGKDLLITGLQAYNFGGGPSAALPGFTTGGSLAGTLGYGDVLFGNASNVRLSYEPQFPTVNPSNLSFVGGNNSVNIYKLLYIFPIADKLTLFAGTNAEVSDAFPAILPFAGEGQGSISRFGNLPAAQRVSGGTSQTGLASAAGFIWTISDAVDLRALYGAVQANLPANQGFPGTPLGAGIFNGSYIAATQLTIKPSKSFDIGLNYAHSYHQINILGTGLASADIGSVLFAPNASELARANGSALVAVANQGITLDTLGATAAFRITPAVTLAGSFTYIFSDLVRVDASTNFISWLVGVHFKDLLTKGGSAGLLFGRPLSRIATGGRAFAPEDETPYQLEGYINFKLTDNISVTPGLFVIFNPEGFSDNPTTYVPVIRTTFTF